MRLQFLQKKGVEAYFVPKIAGTGQPSFTYADISSAVREGVGFMRVMVVKFPKALCGLMRKIFHME